jgi:hypothetical protein
MRWVDVMGPPGVGKSTLCDAAWPPRAIPYDGQPAPLAWSTFLAVCHRLTAAIADHPTAYACQRMFERSVAKMGTVSRMSSDQVYVQTGLAQRGLGFGWRLADPDPIAVFYEHLPVSLGVVILTAPVDMVAARNVQRGKDRSHMVAPMQRPLEIAAQVLRRRGVPLFTIDTTQPIDQCRAALAAATRELAP